jgi:DNA-binding response OmpR family regulator/AraC-like DNA-binding protein
MPFAFSVMVVDDDQAVCDLLCHELGVLGLDVDCAESGERALVLARRHPPDVVLIDLRMPGLDGIDTAVRFRAAHDRVMLLLMSGYELTPAELNRALTIPFLGFLHKPFHPDEVAARVATLLGLSSGGEAPASRPHDEVHGTDVQTLVADLLGVLEATSALRSPRADWLRVTMPVLLHPLASVPLVVACASVMRHAAMNSSAGPTSGTLATLRAAAAYRGSTDQRVLGCLARLEAAGMACGSVHLARVADDLAVDPAHLGRLLHQETGLGFVAWKRGLRLQRAARLLAETDEPVTNVAVDCGFSGEHDPAHFTAVFRWTFGVTPTSFRQIGREALRA